MINPRNKMIQQRTLADLSNGHTVPVKTGKLYRP